MENCRQRICTGRWEDSLENVCVLFITNSLSVVQEKIKGNLNNVCEHRKGSGHFESEMRRMRPGCYFEDVCGLQ